MKTTLLALLFAACLAPLGLRAETNNALYLIAGLDERLLANQDANDYFNLTSGQMGSQGVGGGVLHAGVQLGRFLSLEASVNLGNGRDNNVSYYNGVLGQTREVTTHWDMAQYSLTPAVTFATPGWVSSLGLRVGFAVLGGHVVDNAYGQAGSYDQNAMTPDVGILLRASRIFLRHFSVGLEAGYDHSYFGSVQNTNGTGTYAPPASPERDVSTVGHNGAPTALDFSGPHVALIIGLWGDPPVSEDSGADDAQGR